MTNVHEINFARTNVQGSMLTVFQIEMHAKRTKHLATSNFSIQHNISGR
jgi:hypothetical protein